MRSRAIILLLLAAPPACTAEPVDIRPLDTMPRYVVFRRTETIEIGGGLADPGWAHVDTLPLRLGATRLAARLAFDGDALYLALWAAEPVSCTLAIDADNDGQPAFRQTVIQLEASEHGWQRELVIPFSAIGDATHRPPQTGERMTMTISFDDSTEPVASARLDFAGRAPP